MKFCVRCGTRLDDTDNFCRHCGMPIAAAAPNNTFYSRPAAYQPAAPYDAAVNIQPGFMPPAAIETYNAKPYFIWSIILFFLINFIGTPLAVLGALYASMANDPNCENRGEKLTYSRILCVAATCIDAATLVFLMAALLSHVLL
jgi:hypothetical protein